MNEPFLQNPNRRFKQQDIFLEGNGKIHNFTPFVFTTSMNTDQNSLYKLSQDNNRIQFVPFFLNAIKEKEVRNNLPSLNLIANSLNTHEKLEDTDSSSPVHMDQEVSFDGLPQGKIVGIYTQRERKRKIQRFRAKRGYKNK